MLTFYEIGALCLFLAMTTCLSEAMLNVLRHRDAMSQLASSTTAEDRNALFRRSNRLRRLSTTEFVVGLVLLALTFIPS